MSDEQTPEWAYPTDRQRILDENAKKSQEVRVLCDQVIALKAQLEQAESELEAVKTGKGIANPYLIKDAVIKDLTARAEAAQVWREASERGFAELDKKLHITREKLKIAVEALEFYASCYNCGADNRQCTADHKEARDTLEELK